jgi:hypothetical protein
MSKVNTGLLGRPWRPSVARTAWSLEWRPPSKTEEPGWGALPESAPSDDLRTDRDSQPVTRYLRNRLRRHVRSTRCSPDDGGSSRTDDSCATENGAHPRDVPSLTNLRRRTAEVGGTLGPPIVKGGTPREARREKRTLKLVDPCDHLIGVTASSSPTRPGCLREFKVVRGRSEGWIEQGTTLGIGELWGVDRPMPRCKGWHPSDTPRLDAMSFVKYACECLTTDVVVMTFCAASDRAGAARRSPCPQVRFYFRKTGMVVGSPLALSTTEA